MSDGLGRRKPERGGPDERPQVNWKNVALDVRRAARALIEDPEYQEALRRRLADGKAPRMMRWLWQWADKKSRDPQEPRRHKPPFTIVLKHLPGQYDPLAEKTRQMIEAKATREEQEACARQEACDKQAADTTPEDPPAPDVLEVYRDPSPSWRNPTPMDAPNSRPRGGSDG